MFLEQALQPKMGDFPDITERLKPLFELSTWVGFPALLHPDTYSAVPSTAFSIVSSGSQSSCPSQNTTFCYPLSSLPICPPRQLGWAWVGASTGLAHGRGQVHWLLCRLNGDALPAVSALVRMRPASWALPGWWALKSMCTLMAAPADAPPASAQGKGEAAWGGERQ